MYIQIYEPSLKTVKKMTNIHGEIIITFIDETFIYLTPYESANRGIKTNIPFNPIHNKTLAIHAELITIEEYNKSKESYDKEIEELKRKNELDTLKKLKEKYD